MPEFYPVGLEHTRQLAQMTQGEITVYGEEVPVHSAKYLKRLQNRDVALRRQQKTKQGRRDRRQLLRKGVPHTVVPTGVALDMQNQPVQEPTLPPSTARDATLSQFPVVPIRIVYIIKDEQGNIIAEEPALPRATTKPMHKKF